MTYLYPSGRILIQKAGVVPESGEADFFVLPIAGFKKGGKKKSSLTLLREKITAAIGLVSGCTVAFSTTKEGTAAVTTFQVANLKPKIVRQMAEKGFVKVEAGYIGHPTRQEQVIFFGKLDTATYRIESGQITWSFSASAFPSEFWAIRPHATLPVDADGRPKKILVGEAVRIIADRIGLKRENVRMPKIFDGDLSDTKITARPDLSAKVSNSFLSAVTLENWTTTRTAIEELSDLMEVVAKAIKETFGVVRRYSLLPNVNDPFIIVIEDVDRFDGEFLNIDLDSRLIISAGPSVTKNTVPATDAAATDAADAGAAAEPPNQTVTIQEYEITSIFDPKIAMGLFVKGASKKYDLTTAFHVTKGMHMLNGSPLRWRTQYGGQEQTQIEVARA